MQWDLEMKAKGTSDDLWRDITSGREIWTDAYTTDQWTLTSCKFSGIQFYVDDMRYGSVKQYPTEPEESQRKFLPARTVDDYFNYAGANEEENKQFCFHLFTHCSTFFSPPVRIVKRFAGLQ